MHLADYGMYFIKLRRQEKKSTGILQVMRYISNHRKECTKTRNPKKPSCRLKMQIAHEVNETSLGENYSDEDS